MISIRERRARRIGALPSASASELPDEAAHAVRFVKARMARATAQFEDYVELVADLLDAYGEARTTEVARRFGVTPSTAVKGLARLKREGLATSRPYSGVVLTEVGRKLADRVRARHRLVVRLLLAVGVPTEVAETDAEGMAHHASDVTLEAFARFLAESRAT